MRAIYSIHSAIYNTGQEGLRQPSECVELKQQYFLRELNRQLLKYLLDIQASSYKSISLPILKPQMGFIEALSFLPMNYTINYLINTS